MTEMLFAPKELKPDLLNSAKHLSETAWNNLTDRIRNIEPLAAGGAVLFGATGLVYTVATLHGFHEVGQMFHPGASFLQGAKDYMHLVTTSGFNTQQEANVLGSAKTLPGVAVVFDGLTALFGGKVVKDILTASPVPIAK